MAGAPAIFQRQPNADNGVLQLSRCFYIAPRLETLHLDMVYLNLDDGGSDEVVEEEGSHMSHHGHLRTVYMSGFRCYSDQDHGAGILERHLSVSTSYVSADLQVLLHEAYSYAVDVH
uniref:FBD domain-containing protein n=1 Tax=Aegilops tauschii TaxID=37682 RepID=N1QWP5_AEGTA